MPHFKEPTDNFKAPEIIKKTVWVTRKKKKNHITADAVVTLSVECGRAGRIQGERTVTFEPNKNLEHKGLILPFTLSTYKRSACEIQAVNMSDEDLFLSASIHLGTLWDASVVLSSHFKIVGSQELHISAQPNTEKRMNECPVDCMMLQEIRLRKND